MTGLDPLVRAGTNRPGAGAHQVDGCAVALALGQEWWVGPVVGDGVLSLWLRVKQDSRKFGVFSDDPPSDHHIACGVGPSKKPSCVQDWRIQPTFRAFP